MPILVTCPGCQKTIPIKDKYAGKKGACPHCRGPLMVPAVTAESPTAEVDADDWLGGIENEPAPPARQSAPAPRPAVVKPAAAAPSPSARPAASPPARSARPASTAPVGRPKPTVELDSGSMEMPAVKPPATLSGLKNPLAKPQSKAARAAPPSPAKPQPAAAPSAVAKPAAAKPAAASNDLGLAPLGGDDFLGELAGLPMAPPAAAGGGVVLAQLSPANAQRKPAATKHFLFAGEIKFLYIVCATAAVVCVVSALATFAGWMSGLVGLLLADVVFALLILLCFIVGTAKLIQEGRVVVATVGLMINGVTMIVACRNAKRWGMPWYNRVFNTSLLCMLLSAFALQYAVHKDNSADYVDPQAMAARHELIVNNPAHRPMAAARNSVPHEMGGRWVAEPNSNTTGPPVTVKQPPASMPDDERIKRGLADIGSSDVQKRYDAFAMLESVSPSDALRSQLTAGLQKQVNLWWKDNSLPADRLKLIEIFRKWAAAENESMLVEILFQERHLGGADAIMVMETIAKFGQKQGAVALAKQLENSSRQEQAARCLRLMGPVAESPVWPYLSSQDAKTRLSACEVLADVGSFNSISPLMDTSARFGGMQDASVRAILAIKDRLAANSANGVIVVEESFSSLPQGSPKQNQQPQRPATNEAVASAGANPKAEAAPKPRPTAAIADADARALLEKIEASLSELESGRNPYSHQKLKELQSISPVDEIRADVASRLEKTIEKLQYDRSNIFDRDKLIAVYAAWTTPQNEAKLIEYLAAEWHSDSLKLLLGALARCGTESSAAAIAGRLNHLGDADVAKIALIQMGPVAEKAVWGHLRAQDPFSRIAACEVLAVVGTPKSIKRLRAMKGDFLSLADRGAPQHAIRSILSRFPDSPEAKADEESNGDEDNAFPLRPFESPKPVQPKAKPKPKRGFRPASWQF